MGTITGHHRFADRQARALIVAAEERGFERQPGLFEREYDASLHEDAIAALEHLFVRDADALLAARCAADPICADAAARRIVNGGRVTAADAQRLIAAAEQRGHPPAGSGLALGSYGELFEKAEEVVSYFWDQDLDALVELVGPAVRLAPLPPSVREAQAYA